MNASRQDNDDGRCNDGRESRSLIAAVLAISTVYAVAYSSGPSMCRSSERFMPVTPSWNFSSR